MAVDLPRERYPSGHHLVAFYPLLVERLQAIPGIVSASVSGDIPLEGTGGENLRMPGRDDRLLVRFKRADAGYFTTMGIDLVGRPRLHPGGSRRLAVCDGDQRSAGAPPRGSLRREATRWAGPSISPRSDLAATAGPPMTVVGVIRNERVRSDLRAPVEPMAYVPIAQAPKMQVKVSARTVGDEAAAVPAIRAVVRELDPRLALADIRTMEQIRQRSLSGLREPVWLIGDLRRTVGAARRARSLRRRLALGQSAAPRDWHPHGARRARERRARA